MFAVRPPEADEEPLDELAAEEIGTELGGVVYAFCYENDRKLAQLEGREVFEVKIGKAANGQQRYNTHLGAAKTVIHATPELLGEWQVADRHAAEGSFILGSLSATNTLRWSRSRIVFDK